MGKTFRLANRFLASPRVLRVNLSSTSSATPDSLDKTCGDELNAIRFLGGKILQCKSNYWNTQFLVLIET